ncbi:LysM domain-containing protein [Flavobacterium lacus]|uniref:LysM domain-containing protein n=2 Tax=Flavobacterium lacus TaxID=1353778 RepID=A0A328X124_9FLAO|nr:LysM domain-containing protein [Flavobacterium lacus]
MKKFLFGAMILLSPQITFSQTVVKPGMDTVKHTVTSGETVLDISKKYVVDPAEIYRANRFAIDGVTEGMVLEFYAPQKSPVIEIAKENYTTEVVSKQPEMMLMNKIEVPKKTQKSEAKVTKVTNRVNHKVKSGETLYGLSKLYNVSVDELKNANTILMNNNLQAGQTLKIPDGTIVGNNQMDIVAETKNNIQPSSINQKSEEIFKHTVAPKETLYGLSKKYNVSIDDIINQNEKALKNGLQAGQVLTIKAK